MENAAAEANRLNEENARLRDEIDKVMRERDLARREADRLRHGNTIEGDFVCSMELSAIAATMARESLEATIRFELHALPEESPLDACRRVYAERDQEREACAMWAERAARWHDDMQRAERERDEWRDKFHALNQTAGEICNACGWAFRIPGEPCRCEVVKERDEARATIAQIRRVFGNALAFDDARGDVVKMAEIAYRGAYEGDKAIGQLRDMTRQRDEARAEVERLNAVLSSVTAENQDRAQREARALQDWQALRAERDKARAEVEQMQNRCAHVHGCLDQALEERDEAIEKLEALREHVTGKLTYATQEDPEHPDFDQLDAEDSVDAAAEELRDLRNEVDHWRVKAQAYGGMIDGCGPALEAAGHPIDPFRPDGRVGGIARSVAALVKERDEARAKYEVLYKEADRALRAPLLALSAIVGGDAFFAPGPWDSQTQGMNALAERITRSFAIWRDRAAKQSTEDFKRGAEAMREACAAALMADGLVLSRERAANVVRALPIPEEP